MTDEERTSLVVDSPEWALRVQGSKTQLIGWSLYTLLLWLLKFCMCVFYERLTEGVDNMKSRVRFGYGILFATYLATELSILLGCQPFKHNWQINPDPGSKSHLFQARSILGTHHWAHNRSLPARDLQNRFICHRGSQRAYRFVFNVDSTASKWSSRNRQTR